MIVAVLSRRAGVSLSSQDVLVNVAGGLRISEPAADLGIALAIASSFKDMEITQGLVAVGEIGLSGELRAVPQLERRIAETARLGFRRCLVPASSPKLVVGKMEVLKAGTLSEALRLALSRTPKVKSKEDNS
jgi:DNA repair protein RadA/Sms